MKKLWLCFLFLLCGCNHNEKLSYEEKIKDLVKGKEYVFLDVRTKEEYKIEHIKEAINMANKLDIIVLAGKGHEPYQEINGEKLPYDERIIVKEIIG